PGRRRTAGDPGGGPRRVLAGRPASVGNRRRPARRRRGACRGSTGPEPRGPRARRRGRPSAVDPWARHGVVAVVGSGVEGRVGGRGLDRVTAAATMPIRGLQRPVTRQTRLGGNRGASRWGRSVPVMILTARNNS